MNGGEARLWARMRPGIIAKCFAQRIENMVGSGVPDVILHSRDNGKCALVELKCRPLAPVKGSTPIFKGKYGLRTEQVSWIHSRAANAGAAIYVLGQCGDELWLVHGRHSRELDTFSRELLDFNCSWKGSARRTDWGVMLGVIFGG